MILRVIWRCLELTLHGCRELVCLPFDLQLYRKGEASIALSKSLASLLERLGPTFIKLAQMLSSRPDVFSPAVTKPLNRLCEHVRPIPRGQISGLLSAGFGVPPSHIFRDFEWSPIACGSISQVHRAHLRDGQVVAVKIRRPNAVPSIRADLLLLRWLAACFQHFFILRGIPLLLIINEFGRILETVIQGGKVVITKHDSPKAVLISMDEFKTLSNIPELKINALSAEFDSLLTRMQGPVARASMEAAFHASPQELGRAALAAARKRG